MSHTMCMHVHILSEKYWGMLSMADLYTVKLKPLTNFPTTLTQYTLLFECVHGLDIIIHIVTLRRRLVPSPNFYKNC